MRASAILVIPLLVGACTLAGPSSAELSSVEPEPHMNAAAGPLLRLAGSAPNDPWWEAFAYAEGTGQVCVWTIGQNAGNGGACDEVPDADRPVAALSVDLMDRGPIVSGLLAPGTARAQLLLRDASVDVELRSVSEIATGVLGFATQIPADADVVLLVTSAGDGAELSRIEIRPGDGNRVPLPAAP